MKDDGWGQSSKVYCEKCGSWSLATCQSSICMTCGSQEVKFHAAKKESKP